MQKWEYHTVHVAHSRQEKRYKIHEQGEDLVADLPAELIRAKGEQGWELVSVTPVVQEHIKANEAGEGAVVAWQVTVAEWCSAMVLWFKRPKEE